MTEPISFDIRSPRQLADLAAKPIPGFTSRDARSLHRDLYLDTLDDALKSRGIVCRLRITASDRRILSLRIPSAAATGGLRDDAHVRSADPTVAVMEDTSVGRRLRAITNPANLVVRVELEVDRVTRNADPDWLRRPRVVLHYDDVKMRHNGMVQSFQKLCVHCRRGDADRAQQVARLIQSAYDLRRSTADTRERADLLLRWASRADGQSLEQSGAMLRVAGAKVTQPAVPGEFLNPELSLLEFQKRVLSLAEDERTPLQERLRFLSIVTANVDEFFMVRMAGLRRAAREQAEEQCDDGLTRAERLELILSTVSEIVERQARCYRNCREQLAAIGVHIRSWQDLTGAQQSELRTKCVDEIHPALTPMAMTLSPGHPLPHLPHLTLGLAVVIRDSGGRLRLAEVELPDDAGRFVRISGTEYDVVPLEEVLRANADLLYPSSKVEGAYAFRVTRGGDLTLQEDVADDLLDAVESAVGRRQYNPAVRVEVERGMPEFVRNLLSESLRREAVNGEPLFDPTDIQEVSGLLDLGVLDELRLPDLPQLRFAQFDAREFSERSRSIFDRIAERDLLVHHPFDSFSSTVLQFLQQAATDPDVTAIKITLYRLGKKSPIVESLLEAARNGKQVVAFVELKARFDEEHNVSWARKLESAGGHVVSGMIGIKNHAKVLLVVRRENGRLRRYVHVGTGNYNARTARQYTDLSLFSARNDLAADVGDLFNALTGGSGAPAGLSRGSLISPNQLLDEILRAIEREAAIARSGRPARITAKMNGLSDAEVVRALYSASRDGVQIDLVVRSICTLRPRVPGQSDHIRVVSVLGRFLEHSRIYRFENDGDPRHFIGSADMRPRNLRRRVELLAPVTDPEHRAELDRLLALYFEDPTAWELTASGEWVRRTGGLNAQDALVNAASRSTYTAVPSREQEQQKQTVGSTNG